MLPVIFFLMQYMVSAKAGLVNYVDGQVNVRLQVHIAFLTALRWYSRESSARRINRRPLREATRSHCLATATQSATSLSSPMASWTSGVLSDQRLWRKRMRWHITTTTAATLTLFGTIRIGTYIPAGPPGFTARF